VVFDNYLQGIDQVEERLRALDQHVEAVSLLPAYAEAVGALRSFRGIDTLTAMGLVAELHDFIRFDSARGLMAFLGPVPSEFSLSRVLPYELRSSILARLRQLQLSVGRRRVRTTLAEPR
jgi:transposase